MGTANYAKIISSNLNRYGPPSRNNTIFWYYFFMLQNLPERAVGEIQPFSMQSWEHQAGNTFIADIEPLGIDEDRSRYVGQGRVSRWMPGDPELTLMSEGFSKCESVIVYNPTIGSFDFAHAQPLDDRLYEEMRSLEFGDSPQAFFVFGKHSMHQYDIEQLLAQRGARIIPVHLDTGDAHFGVALDVNSASVSVVSKTPDHTVFQYRPFIGM